VAAGESGGMRKRGNFIDKTNFPYFGRAQFV
jgi:hypothetical protein